MSSVRRSPFPATFYVANTMEIFERLAWYGFFSLSSLYMTSPTSHGGLGFSDQERGFLQGMIPFLLYLLPVLTGALADRYGYRRMFLCSFALMAPSYYLLGQVESFWAFFMAFTAVAVGAACFKPVVVGTVGRCSDDSNRGLAFGIFYTMVNIGGFVGPLVAGYLRAISWDWVFVMSSLWILINFIPALFWYRDPVVNTSDQRTVRQVLQEMQQVLGNGRLALLVLPLLLGLMFSPRFAISWWQMLLVAGLWIGLNLGWSYGLRLAKSLHSNGNSGQILAWYQQQMQLGNGRFVCFLLLLTGFFTAYNQLFITLPVYLRDYVDTRDLVQSLAAWSPTLLDYFAAVNIPQLAAALPALAIQFGTLEPAQWQSLVLELAHHKILLPPDEMAAGLQALLQQQLSAEQLASQWAAEYRQINPEYIVNLGFATIVLAQIAISTFIERWPAIPVLVVGTVVMAAGLLGCGLSGMLLVGGVTIVGAVVVFSCGEMIASPKSQEYVAAIAPRHQTAMYMGYYFVAMALGNLFAGLLSGFAYTVIAKQMNQPLLMWVLFAGIALLTAAGMLIFHYWVQRQPLPVKLDVAKTNATEVNGECLT
ncbi:MFS transporter [Rheinheimera sp. SA_1]|uniref:MFS transporter n=1 Tax=Rheinheimera sp. SA_1 TaxID=1827365 RepID=UPI0008020C15|nr:MFS transporter [Rheinheimera sp. SA_1]OBP13388.1 MFS transporter [Rheinheimera sp. SA_1]